jgi:DNA-binding LacI/PurR family transcriptional regulator
MPVIRLIDQRSPEALAANRLRGFRQALRDAGFADGQNAAIEYRWAENKPDRLQALMQSILSESQLAPSRVPDWLRAFHFMKHAKQAGVLSLARR